MVSVKDRNPEFGGVRDLVRTQMVEQALPSFAVAVARDGKIIWEEAFGWADREQRVPATPHTLYSLASITKPITATGLMALQERGVLDLDRAINDYLGEAKLRACAGETNAATVRRVANHTAGLPLHYHFFYADEPYRRPPMDETIRRYGKLFTAPGERFLYSNLGYGLLDYVISRLSRQSYTDFMRQQVFLPLGMLHASVDVAPGLHPYQAARYGSDGIPYPCYDFDHQGGSAVFCSAHDLARFAMFHLKQRLADQKAIISDESIDEMQVASATHDTFGYGIGWMIEPDNHGFRRVGHGGDMGGVRTILAMLPTERITVVALANAPTDLPYRLVEEILAVLLPGYRQRLDEARGKAQAPEVDEQAARVFELPQALQGAWEGVVQTYAGDLSIRCWIKVEGAVHFQIGSQLRALVNDVRWDGEWLGGRMIGDIGTEDAKRRPYHLHLDFKLRGPVLGGALVAITPYDESEGGAPERRVGNALSYWAELRKVS